MTAKPQGQAAVPDVDIPKLIAQHVSNSRYQMERLLRVGRVLRDMSCARQVSDKEIRQHAQDCADLATAAMTRFDLYGNPADREEALLWSYRRDEAHRSLSPAWKAAREAEIQRAIGADFFMDQADAARARIGERG